MSKKELWTSVNDKLKKIVVTIIVGQIRNLWENYLENLKKYFQRCLMNGHNVLNQYEKIQKYRCCTYGF